nr:MAG TPA: hypothetical protein [Caudoviricetes sp.]
MRLRVLSLLVYFWEVLIAFPFHTLIISYLYKYVNTFFNFFLFFSNYQ